MQSYSITDRCRTDSRAAPGLTRRKPSRQVCRRVRVTVRRRSSSNRTSGSCCMTGGGVTGEGHWHGRVDRGRQGLLGQGSGERRRPPHCDAAGPQQAAARLAANRSSRETTRFSIDLRPARNADFVQYCGVRPVWQPAGGSSRDPPHADTASVRKQLKRIDARVCGVWRFRLGSSSQCCRVKPRQQTWHTVCCSS